MVKEKEKPSEYLLEIIDELKDTEESVLREIKKMGNSAHVLLPNEHIGKHARVLVLKKRKEKWTNFKEVKNKSKGGKK